MPGALDAVAVGDQVRFHFVEQGDRGRASVRVADYVDQAVDRVGAGLAEHAGGEEAEVGAPQVGADGGIGEEFVEAGVGAELVVGAKGVGSVVVEIVVDISGGQRENFVGGEAADGAAGGGEDPCFGVGFSDLGGEGWTCRSPSGR